MIIYGLRAPLPFLKSHVRHVRPLWLLEEMGQTYDLQFLDLEKGEEDGEAFLAINPFGKVPALKDGAFTLFESGAICTYLADKHGKFIPPGKTPERAIHDQWMYTAVTMVEPHTVRILAADFFYKDTPEGPGMRSTSIEALEDTFVALDSHLKGRAYLTGKDFTVSDIMMTASLRLIKHTDLLSGYPNITAYLARNTERPAFIKAAVQQ